MQKELFKHTMKNMASDAYMINARTRLLDLERLGGSITIHHHIRHFLGPYKCIDTPCEPLTLDRFTLNGGLIYYKVGRYDWRTVSFDDIDAIYEN